MIDSYANRLILKSLLKRCSKTILQKFTQKYGDGRTNIDDVVDILPDDKLSEITLMIEKIILGNGKNIF